MPYVDDEDGYSSKAKSEADQLRALQLSAAANVYEGADRILTGDPVKVHVVKEGAAISWSDGENIYLNAQFIPDMSTETLTKISGINYHELAHHFYTPREGTTLVKNVIAGQYFTSFNILEDARIESLLCARYPSVMPYLQASALIWLQSTPDAVFTNYPLIAGRRHIDVSIREAFRDMFYKPELIPDIQRITNEYRTLAFPRDYKRAEALIIEFHEKVISQMDIPPQCGLGGCDSRAPIKKGRPEPGKAQERDARVAQGMGKPESEYIPKEPAEPSEGESSGQGDIGDGDSDGNGPTVNVHVVEGDGDDGEGSSQLQNPVRTVNTNTTAEEALQKREEQVNTKPNMQWGAEHVKSAGGIPEHIDDMLTDSLDSIYNNKAVIKDIRRKQNIIVHGDENWQDDSELGKFDSTAVPGSALMDYRRFANELRKLRDDAEPGWEREVNAGKLNMPRVMRGTEIDKAFDRWTEGDDSTDIEAVILIDRSGSMSSYDNDKRASIACWTIKRALESIDCPVTVYAFDDKNEIAYRKQDKAERTKYRFIFGHGGTNPYDSLLLAEKAFMMSTHANKILFVITDGAFDSDKNDPIIKRLSKRGVLTTMVLIMQDREWEEFEASNKARAQRGMSTTDMTHGAEIYARVNSGKDLLQLAKSVVVGAIKKRQFR